MENHAISDRQITASSEWDERLAASHGRLHFKVDPPAGKAGAWSARTNDASQWLQVDLRSNYIIVKRVATQGRNRANQWVTKYRLQFSNHGVNFQYYREHGKAKVKAVSRNIVL